MNVLAQRPSSQAQRRRGERRTDETSTFAGAVLVGWLLVEVAFIREFSFVHPTYGAIGIAFVVAGRRRRRDLVVE